MAGPWQLNDVRIYDHALSAKEVEEIAKGLVLHYKLDNNGLGGENLLANSKLDGSYTYPTSSYNKDWYASITTSIPDGDIYTLSFEAKSTVSGDKMRTYYYSPNTTTTCVSSQGITKTASDGYMDFTLSTSWTKYWVTYTQTATTAVKHVICPRLVSGQGTGTVSVRNVKLEKGSVATAWCPAKTDTLYAALDTEGVIYDSSGYNNNGTIVGSLETTTPSPRYSCATYFNGTDTFIEAESLPIETKTISAWIKWNNIPASTPYSVPIHDKNSGLAIGVYENGNKLICYAGPAAGGTGSCISCSLTINNWYHIVVVKTGDTTRDVYINGVKAIPTSNNWWGGDLNKLNIGCRHISGNYAGYFNGSISDFRAYTIALTAE